MFRAVLHRGRISERAISTDTIANVLSRVSASAGIGAVTPHSLRAGCVTVATSLGATPLAVRRVTGHKSMEQLARYDRAEKTSPPLDFGL